MVYDPARHHRKSIRLQGYDYSRGGAYYVPIGVSDRQNRLGRMENGKIMLSPAGEIVNKYWNELPEHSNYFELDEYFIMPNHVHRIMIMQHDGPNMVDKQKSHYHIRKNICERGLIGFYESG